jgi:hypothetical protein
MPRTRFTLPLYLLAASSLHGQSGLLVSRYDASATRANPHETVLSVANVKPATVGKLWSYYVDGAAFAQPPYVPVHSEMQPKRDRLGTLVEFVPPTVITGRVPVPNYDNAVSLYGLLGRRIPLPV